MTVQAYVGVWLGVDKVLLDQDTGLILPRMISALAEGSSAIVVSFDKDMDFSVPTDSPITRILLPDAWVISDTVGSDVIRCVQVEKINERDIRLYTNYHEATTYEVSITNIRDAEGNYLDPSYDSVTVVTAARTYPSNNDFHTFMGLYTGMQEEEQNNILPDLFPPELLNRVPPPGAIDQDRNTLIELDLIDDESGVDLNTVEIYVEGALAYRGDLDTFVAPFTGGLSLRNVIPFGHNFVLDKGALPYKYDSYKTVEVRVVAYDAPLVGTPNALDETYSFRIEDYIAPQIEAQYPTGVGVDENALVSFRLTDTGESGVDPDTINVVINGQAAISAGVFIDGWDGTSSVITANGFDGFDVVVDKTDQWDTFEWYTVNVTARDYSNNLLTANWTFQSEDWLGPLVVPVDPVSGQLNVDIENHITVDIYDERGVVEGSILIRVDLGDGYVDAYEQGGAPEFKGGFNGPESSVTPIAGGYRVLIDLEEDLNYGTTYYVEVTATDPDGNPERLS